MHVIGLTGGIASGKSTVAALLAARGAAIVDADLVAREIVLPGQPALGELVARFGASILAADGTLDRKRLGALAFADPTARSELQRITHPRIAAASATAIARHASGGAGIVIYEAALLVENKAHLGLAGLIVVAAEPAVQHARLVGRDGLTPAEADARIAAQAPLADKLAAATWVVRNDGDRDALTAQLDAIVTEIEARYGPLRAPAPAAPRPPLAGRRASDVTFVTGYPALAARRMIAKLAAAEPTARLTILAADAVAAEATAFAAALPGRVEILVGAVEAMDLGLASGEYRALARDATWIHHLADAGTDTILELARDAPRLERLVFWSSALVSGDRTGTVYEDDLESGQRFPHARDRARYQAERRVRAAARHLPITILRPGILVGDASTGEIDELAGPYPLITLIATNPSTLAIPLVGRGDAPLHLVPVDYAVEAAYAAIHAPDAAGQTFHLVDPAPLPARRIFELVAQHAGTVPPRGRIPGPLARALLRGPALLSRFFPVPKMPHALADSYDREVRYDATNTERAPPRHRLVCPSVSDYLPALVRHVLAVKRSGPRPGTVPTE